MPANTQKMTRFAPYIESRHKALLNTVAEYRSLTTDSPYESYADQDINNAMFGAGYAIADFPSLCDMFGKFMSGFDLESLWSGVFEDQQVVEITTGIKAEMDLINDGMLRSTPEFKLAMRDLNAVNSSSFVIGKANIERSRTAKLAKISSEAKLNRIIDTLTEYNSTLNWKKAVVDSYAELMKLYHMSAVTGAEADTTFVANNVLWPFTALDFERCVLGAMRQQAGYVKSGAVQRKRSAISKVLLVSSYTANGATIGYMIGGPYGAVIGAIVGFVVGVAVCLFE